MPILIALLKNWYPDDSGEWIEYDGSGQPVEDDVCVEVIMEVEQRGRDYAPILRRAEDWDWNAYLYDTSSDIVAYKVVKQ